MWVKKVQMKTCIAIVLILILLISYISINSLFSEQFENDTIQENPYIKLYERFNGKNLIFDFEPLLDSPGALHLRKYVRAEIKSIDLNFPLKNDGFDDVRYIKIWNVYGNDVISSSEADFYNS